MSSKAGYDGGRLNLPFVGISTFGKNRYVEDWDAIDADVAILGAAPGRIFELSLRRTRTMGTQSRIIRPEGSGMRRWTGLHTIISMR